MCAWREFERVHWFPPFDVIVKFEWVYGPFHWHGCQIWLIIEMNEESLFYLHTMKITSPLFKCFLLWIIMVLFLWVMMLVRLLVMLGSTKINQILCQSTFIYIFSLVISMTIETFLIVCLQGTTLLDFCLAVKGWLDVVCSPWLKFCLILCSYWKLVILVNKNFNSFILIMSQTKILQFHQFPHF